MMDLLCFELESFDFIFNLVLIIFVFDVECVWKEVWCVLRFGGCFLIGVMNLVFYMFDYDVIEVGVELVVNFVFFFDDI